MGRLEDVALGVRHPTLLARKLNQFAHSRFGRWEYNRNGIDIFERDWDNLLLLDALRVDMLDDELFGEPVETVESRGSGTIEFLRGNVGDRDLTDTVYVTANPQLYRNRDQFDPEFHDVINVWMEDGWDDEYGTVLPETMYERTLEAAEQYPNKRLLVHFIQPHYPFLSSESGYGHGQMEGESEGFQLWMQVVTGEIGADEIEDVIRDYEENLAVVLPYIEDLLSELGGKTVVTSDHGNLLGERTSPIPVRDWGHPLSLYAEELVSVPWVTFENGERREIVAEVLEKESSQTTDEVVTERLEQLGYK
jgi:hypothetical protein